ncbi:codanin-1 [Bombina bombina]|uniref:codanin-1 n=1 Tax=Bombina bombina TaxID=8345 RepID=UPI00235B1340|nr:codanin-1 [Bombina bombina]
MAAVLELLLLEEVSVNAVLRWLITTTQETSIEPNLVCFNHLRKDFVPFLLNYLREQTHQIISNGPSTPAKTPNSKAFSRQSSHIKQSTVTEKRSVNVSGHRGSRIQLFNHTPNSSYTSDTSFPSHASVSNDSSFFNKPANCSFGKNINTSPSLGCSPLISHNERRSAHKANLGHFLAYTPEGQSHRRSRKKSNSSGRQVPKDQSRRSNDEESHSESPWYTSRRKQECNSSPVSPPSVSVPNFDNLEEFPPMNSSTGSASKSKPSRRINPTPINDVYDSKSRMCFTSTPISQTSISRHQTSTDVFTAVQEENSSPSMGGSLHEEREILKKERSKLLQHSSTTAGISLDPITPTKQSYCRNASISADSLTTCAELAKVTYSRQLGILAELYSSCISENLVPNIFLELFFVLQLLTSRGPSSSDDGGSDLDIKRGFKDAVEQQHFQSVHNCVYFAVLVLDFQFPVISYLDKGTLKVLAECDRVGEFSPSLQKQLLTAYKKTSTAKVSPVIPPTIQSVSFQPETDNRSNFPSDREFHIFKKQRDIFYELLREWEDSHEKTDWNFERCLGNKIRAMMFNLSAACNHSHFARLFQKQLVQLCKGPSGGGTSGDTPDQDVLNMLGSDNLSKLKRLQERFVTPQSVGGPCPPPSFSGYQEFFRDFILSAGSYLFNQHLMDSLCQEIKKLDGISIEGHESADTVADMDEQDEKNHFASVILTLRLLAKFLGFVTFLPYRTTEILSNELKVTAAALRNQSLPMLDVLQLLRSAIHKHRIVLTVPWAVEYLSHVDQVAPFLDYYKKVFGLLLSLYRYKLILAEEKEICFLNKMLLLAVLGWLFQVPSVPEEMFFNEIVPDGITINNVVVVQGLDYMPLVDQQLLYICCPYIGELRKLVMSFVAGCGSKNGGFIRKITPTAAEPLVQKPSLTQKKLQAELEQAFFHNQPPSLRRTVEFVAERIGSNCVKNIKATLVAELVKRAEAIMEDKITEDQSSNNKLLDNLCSELCEEGKQAVQTGRVYCKMKVPEAIRVLLPEEVSEGVRILFQKFCSLVYPVWEHATFSSMVIGQLNTDLEVVGEERKDILCIAVGPRGEEEGVEYSQLQSFVEQLSKGMKCRKYLYPMAEHYLAKCSVELASFLVSARIRILGLPNLQTDRVDGLQSARNEAISSLVSQLLSIWKTDFRVPIPLHLIFSKKNISCITDAQHQEWEMLVFMLQGLVQRELLGTKEIQHHIHRLHENTEPSVLFKDLESISKALRFDQEMDKLKETPSILVTQSSGTALVNN